MFSTESLSVSLFVCQHDNFRLIKDRMMKLRAISVPSVTRIVVVVVLVDIDAQAARDSTASDIW